MALLIIVRVLWCIGMLYTLDRHYWFVAFALLLFWPTGISKRLTSRRGRQNPGAGPSTGGG